MRKFGLRIVYHILCIFHGYIPKQKRLRIYSDMLKHFESSFGRGGICGYLMYYEKEEIKIFQLKELWINQPSRKYFYGYWFTLNNQKDRINFIKNYGK